MHHKTKSLSNFALPPLQSGLTTPSTRPIEQYSRTKIKTLGSGSTDQSRAQSYYYNGTSPVQALRSIKDNALLTEDEEENNEQLWRRQV
jgi:hypothetical protein